MAKYSKPKTIQFKDYPDFTPNLTPRQIFEYGSFGGTYWRPITSKIVNKKLVNQHKKFPSSWWKGLEKNDFAFKDYDITKNKYGVKVGTTLEFWESKKWITKHDPYGWVEWYCNFYKGRRCEDDRRQIDRWKGITGENGRFRKWLITLILKKHKTAKGPIDYNDKEISPKIRQTLQHWGYKLTKPDFNKEVKNRSKK